MFCMFGALICDPDVFGGWLLCASTRPDELGGWGAAKGNGITRGRCARPEWLMAILGAA
jgi:hypothetical protein